MLKQITLFISLLLLSSFVSGIGIDIKTSSVISMPDIEVVGEYNNSWYVLGFEKRGNLNKPPQYKIFKYAPGFKTCKISVLYPSFGEKTYYMRAAFLNGKLSLFYAVCERRTDEEAMLDGREGHKVLPVIYRKDFDANTLEPVGQPVLVHDERDEYFAVSGIEVMQSDDRTKTALLFKPFYKHQKFKVLVMEKRGEILLSKTYDFKPLKQYLKFLQAGVNNEGNVFISTKMRDDVITYKTTDKNQTAFYIFSVAPDRDNFLIDSVLSPAGGKYMSDPISSVTQAGELVWVNDYYGDARRTMLGGTSLIRFNANLNRTATREVEPDDTFFPQATAFYKSKSEMEFAKSKAQQILPLNDNGFLLICEHQDSTAMGAERNYILSYTFDDNMAVSSTNFINKKQKSQKYGYAFSAQPHYKGGNVYMFYNADWYSDEENNMNLLCKQLPTDGSEPAAQKVVNTSDYFFTNCKNIYRSFDGRILLEEIKLVDYEDVSAEVKLLEITLH